MSEVGHTYQIQVMRTGQLLVEETIAVEDGLSYYRLQDDMLTCQLCCKNLKWYDKAALGLATLSMVIADIVGSANLGVALLLNTAGFWWMLESHNRRF